MEPDRIVMGLHPDADRQRVIALLGKITDRIEWMSIEAAEMTKHALNAFLATSIVFMNELAVLCEQVGVDAKEVERGLKTEARIGPGAYLKPGGAFAGGTLARDLAFLENLGKRQGMTSSLFGAVSDSNIKHKEWPFNRTLGILGDLRGKVIAILGLTYKPGTSTLRRSSAVALCRSLVAAGAEVRAHDPAVEALPLDLNGVVLCPSWQDTLVDADALVVATEWPEYKQVTGTICVEQMRTPVVIDSNRFLASIGADPRIRYFAIGKPYSI
jgi:UDPglucose 6-dehydrogenase